MAIDKTISSDIEALIGKAREFRSLLLLAGDTPEIEAKRTIAAVEFTEKFVVLRELVIQGKCAVSGRMAEFLKSEPYRQFKETLDAFRGIMDSGTASQRVLTSTSFAQTERSALRLKLCACLEDLVLSA